MTDRETMQQALEAMETNQYTVAELAPHKVVMKFNDAINALRTALAREHAVHELARLGQEIEQEPTPWRDMVVVSLVREGINKHRARELADHFAAQPAPLTQKAIIEIAKQTKSAEPGGQEGYILPVSFARAIEAAHNIKENT